MTGELVHTAFYKIQWWSGLVTKMQVYLPQAKQIKVVYRKGRGQEV